MNRLPEKAAIRITDRMAPSIGTKSATWQTISKMRKYSGLRSGFAGLRSGGVFRKIGRAGALDDMGRLFSLITFCGYILPELVPHSHHKAALSKSDFFDTCR